VEGRQRDLGLRVMKQQVGGEEENGGIESAGSLDLKLLPEEQEHRDHGREQSC
jgi:hypothetical protein